MPTQSSESSKSKAVISSNKYYSPRSIHKLHGEDSSTVSCLKKYNDRSSSMYSFAYKPSFSLVNRLYSSSKKNYVVINPGAIATLSLLRH